MKIIRFEAENFKRIKVVRITPDGNMVQLTGPNGSGKSSCLDAIWAAIKGPKDFKQTKPVRKGAEKATIRLDLGDMVVTRTFTDRGDDPTTMTLRVENKDGFRAPEPQKMLDALVGPLTIDPLEFSRMKPREQFDTLRGFVPGFDFDAEDALNRSDFNKRTDINRDAKRARSAAEAIVVPDSIDASTQPVDEAALTQELAWAGEHNGGIEARVSRLQAAVQRIAELQTAADQEEANIPGVTLREEAQRDRAIEAHQRRIVDLEKQIADENESIAYVTGACRERIEKDTAYLKDHAERFRTEAADLQKLLDAAPALPDPIDIESLTARITEARNTNAAIRVREQRAQQVAEAERLEAEAEALTTAMAARDKAKADAIAAAKMPVDGLSFGAGEILLNGFPFDQASDAERLRTSCAIAMAMSPKLRIIRVRDGSLLDENGLRLLAEMADANDCQVWLEQVSTDGRTGFVLEDGHLAGVTIPEPEAPAASPPKGQLI